MERSRLNTGKHACVKPVSYTHLDVYKRQLIHGSSTGVGVGTTSIGAKLDVNGSIRSSSQLISTVATGTAPLAVTSTTVVTNLNADRVDSIHASSTPTANYLLPLDSALRFNAPLYIPDTRSAATTPGSYNQEAAWNFKSNSTIGLSSAGRCV